MYETFIKDLRHFPHVLAVSQTLKAIPKYIRHFPTCMRHLSKIYVCQILKPFPHVLAVSQTLKAIPKYIRHFPIFKPFKFLSFKPFVKFLSHFQDSQTDSQILKTCPMYLSHFPNILAISQISKSFSTFFKPFVK